MKPESKRPADGAVLTHSAYKSVARKFVPVAMLSRSALRSLSSARQFSSSAARQSRVAVLGAGGGIGQPLSLLLKTDPLVSSLRLYDIKGAPGVAADVSHVDTPAEVQGYAADQLDQALDGVDVVVIPAGVPRKVSSP